jgi:hypothetical protein
MLNTNDFISWNDGFDFAGPHGYGNRFIGGDMSTMLILHGAHVKRRRCNFVIRRLLQWSPGTSVVTDPAPNGVIEFMETMILPDTNAVEFPVSTNRYYRARLAP